MGGEVSSPAEVTIIVLFYRSASFVRGFLRLMERYTPELARGRAQILAIGNSPTMRVHRELTRCRHSYYRFVRPPGPLLLPNGGSPAGPSYLSTVYAAYNFGVSKAPSDYVSLWNSDMVPSPGWLEECLRLVKDDAIVSPRLVERQHPKFGVFPGAIERNFGSNFGNFQEDAWERFCRAPHAPQTSLGSPFMPVLGRRSVFQIEGGFPEGNFIDGVGQHNYADEFFYRALKARGIRHEPVPSSLAYHFKEGERETSPLNLISNRVVPKMRSVGRKAYRRYVHMTAAGWANRGRPETQRPEDRPASVEMRP